MFVIQNNMKLKNMKEQNKNTIPNALMSSKTVLSCASRGSNPGHPD